MKAPGFLSVFFAFIAAAAFAGPQRASRPGVVLPPAAVDNDASCDIGTYPAATLLLPYFEVEVRKHVNDAANTIFSVINTSRQPQIVRVTIWTDYGYPAIWFNMFLTGYDVAPVSLYDVIANGTLPHTSSAVPNGARAKPNDANPYIVSLDGCGELGGPLQQSVIDGLVSLLTSGKQEGGCRLGGEHPMATGYVTVDVVNSCTMISPLEPDYYAKTLLYDNVLTGDYERVAPDKQLGNYAGGNPLVHIRAIPGGGPAGSAATGLPYTFYDRMTPATARHVDRRQPLPSSFAARFIEGGTAAFQTDYAIWREAQTAASTSCTSTNAAIPYVSITRYDEFENPTVGSGPHAFPVSAATATTSSAFPPRVGASVSGWMFLDLDNRAGVSAQSPFSSPRPSQNWVIVHMRAEGRYGVDYDATSLANGCTNTLGSGGVTK
jgi:hypothetical protein